MRAVVADDQPVICAGAALLAAQPGIEVVDVRMSVMEGIVATGPITARHATKVLILTAFDLDEHVFDAIKSGASGFLLKDVTAERLVEGCDSPPRW